MRPQTGAKPFVLYQAENIVGTAFVPTNVAQNSETYVSQNRRKCRPFAPPAWAAARTNSPLLRRPMRLQKGPYLADRQWNALLGLLPGIDAYLGPRGQHRGLHCHRVWMRRDIVRQD